MKLQRYWVGNEEGEGWPEACDDGKWILAKEFEDEKQTLVEMFKSCRDATGYSDSYLRGMYNGIEWALSYLTGADPDFKTQLDTPPETSGDVPTAVEFDQHPHD